MEFEWDDDEALANVRKHGVPFEEAATVWNDLFNIDLFDHDHSADEERFLIIGESVSSKLLIVSYTERENRIRIIGARELTPKERREYEHGYFE
jgi:uncharacterized protein